MFRSDSFDLNVALQDHFKFVKKEDTISKVSVFYLFLRLDYLQDYFSVL